MENATKALLIAAGILLTVMIISLLVIGYNKISSFYQQSEEILTVEQLDKFNKQFQNYNRGDIRGNELISLMNKVIDYNVSQSYQEGTNYKPIRVEIKIGDQFVDSFRYDTDTTGAKNSIIKSVINNTINNVNNQANDKKLVEIASTPDNLRAKAKDEIGIEITDTQLQKLTMEISNILIEEDKTDNSSNEYRRLRMISLRNILKLNIGTTPENTIRLNPTTYKTEDGEKEIKAIREIVSQYYQYTQFKRAYFKCTEMLHDTDTGRVIGMNFEVQTKEQGGETVVQFD